MEHETLLQLPFDTQLEEHIIGCMIYEPACIAEAVDILKPRYFYHRAHAKICERIFELWTADEKSVDLTALAPTFEQTGVQFSRMTEVIRSISTVANIEQHCERLRDIAALRAAIRVGQELGKHAGLRDPDEIRQAIATAESKLARVTDMTIKIETMSNMKDAVLAYHETLERLVNGSGVHGGITGLPSGLRDLDAMTAGFQDADLIVIGARPSMGKTTLMTQLALNMSLLSNGEPGEPGAIFSAEMSTEKLVMRMISNLSGIDMQNLQSGLLLDEEWGRYTTAISMLANANLVIDDQSGPTVAEIKAKARKIKRERGLRYIMIDYLGKLRGDDRRMTRYELMSENIRSLKDLAKDLGIPVIVLAQLSRRVEERQDKRPMMSDLRETGEIEQEADLIGFLYRDDYYNKDSDKKNITEFIIAKHRNGPVGSVEFAFLKNQNKFADLNRGGHENVEQMALL